MVTCSSFFLCWPLMKSTFAFFGWECLSNCRYSALFKHVLNIDLPQDISCFIKIIYLTLKWSNGGFPRLQFYLGFAEKSDQCCRWRGGRTGSLKTREWGGYSEKWAYLPKHKVQTIYNTQGICRVDPGSNYSLWGQFCTVGLFYAILRQMQWPMFEVNMHYLTWLHDPAPNMVPLTWNCCTLARDYNDQFWLNESWVLSKSNSIPTVW